MPPKKRTRNTTSPDSRSPATRKVAKKDNRERTESISQNEANPENERTLIKFNVGGKVITTLVSTLLTLDSIFGKWIKNNFEGLPKDGMGYPFIDRDYDSFLHILNFFRGYGLPSHTDQLIRLAEDAKYFEIDELLKSLGVIPPERWRFNAGPGVNKDGNEFSTNAIVNVCGTEPLFTDRQHRIQFRVDKLSLLEVGVVSSEDVLYDTFLHSQNNSIVYDNTGSITSSTRGPPVFTSYEAMKLSDVVTVGVRFIRPTATAEVTKAVVSFQKGEAAKVEVVWENPPRLQFAVGLHDSSSITIVGVESSED